MTAQHEIDAGGTVEPPQPTGIAEAQRALADLRHAMSLIPLPSPRYRKGSEPSAADACRQLLDLMDWNVQQIAAFLGVPVPQQSSRQP